MLNGLTEGRVVHYVYDSNDLDGEHQHLVGQHRAAIVVNRWPDLNRDDGYSNLSVFTDHSNDGLPAVAWMTSRSFSEGQEPGTWHWPERD